MRIILLIFNSSYYFNYFYSSTYFNYICIRCIHVYLYDKNNDEVVTNI